MDVKIIAPIATAVASAIGLFIWNRGKAAGEAAIRAKIDQLHAELEKAKATPDTADDAAVESKIRNEEQLLAAIRAL